MKSILVCCLMAALAAGMVLASEPVTEFVETEQDEAAASLDDLSVLPWRPKWAPLPVFREDNAAVPTLLEMLASMDAGLRAKAAFLLGQVDDPESKDSLAIGLTDANRLVRLQCGVALACMGDERGIPASAAVLQSGPTWIQHYAVYGLWRINSLRARTVLLASRSRDALISQAIKGALESPYAAPSTVTRTDSLQEITPDDILGDAADLLIREADWWWHKGNYPQIIRCLEAQLFLDPGDVQSYNLIAWLQWSMGDGVSAVRTLKRGIEVEPDDSEAHFALGMHYWNTRRYSLAEEPFRRALELSGNHLDRRMYAHCLERLGKLCESLAQWEIIVKERPNDPAAENNRDRVKKLIGG